MAPVVWNEENAAHLYRRAAFGATPADIDTALAEGLYATVDRLMNYTSVSTADMDNRIALLNLDLTTNGGIVRWWTARMCLTPRPLEERMTLFWHDHFATAISKVAQAAPMLAQNILLRQHALGNFPELAVAISRDVAMLIWLDNQTSVKDHPNENYGRELLELFCLGQGNYSELDVYSAAKAFTGWTISRQTRAFIFRDEWHDHSQKDFLGRVGDWNGDDIIDIACGEFAHGRLIASKLFAWFAYENPPLSIVDPLAQLYLDSGHSIAALVRAILVSDAMYSAQAVWGKVKAPVDHAIIGYRQLCVTDDRQLRFPVGPMGVQGQTLFNPPDVAGWDSGMSWISSGSLLSRMNYASSLTSNMDMAVFLAGATFTTVEAMVDIFLHRLGPLPVTTATRNSLIAYVSPSGVMPTGTTLLRKQQGLAHMILSLPEWQMV